MAAGTRLCGVLTLGLLAGSPAHAADISVDRSSPKVTIISVSGEFVSGDERKFANVAVSEDNAVVLFDSPGGRLFVGTEIGEAIRLKGFGTAVGPNGTCASACGLAWLGGRTKFAAPTAKIGFHAAFKDGETTASGAGNALVGAYLNKLGYSPSAIIYLTDQGPSGMQWLSFADARRIGIDVVELKDDPTPPRSAAQAPAQAGGAPWPGRTSRRDNWGAYGDWVQIASHPLVGDAEQRAVSYQPRLSPSVFRYRNGWFAVVLGPFPAGTGLARRDELLASGLIPSDSIVANPDKMDELVFGANPVPAVPASVRTSQPAPQQTSQNGEALAKWVFEDYLRRWSMDNGPALAGIDERYGEAVQYYGKTLSRADVMREKRAFAERWPLRRYAAQPGSLTATCSDAAGECAVSGLIEWRAESPQRSAVSVGSAQYEFRVRFFGSRALIVGESGTVLKRVSTR